MSRHANTAVGDVPGSQILECPEVPMVDQQDGVSSPKPKRGWLPIGAVAVFAVVVIVVAIAGANGGDRSTTGAEPAADGTVTVLYEVEGSTDYADVTMETPTGSSQISPDVPMTRKSDGRRGLSMEFAPGAFVYLSAQNNRGYGTVTCRITVDGVVVSENSASGGYAIATCEGSA